MHDKVLRLKTPADCESFATNVVERSRARRKSPAVELRATAYGAEKESEHLALQSVYAAEAALSAKNGKKTRASRTWQSIARWGLLQTVGHVVCKRKETDAYNALPDMDMADSTFESVVVRHPDDFSAKTVARAQKRLATQQEGEHA